MNLFYNRFLLNAVLGILLWAGLPHPGFTQSDFLRDKVEEKSLNQEETISDIEIHIKDAPASSVSRYQDMARHLIKIEPGEKLTKEKVDTALDNLKKSNRFKDIFVDIKSQQDKRILFFRLSPFRLVKEIHVDGAYPLFSSNVVNIMTLGTGHTFTQEKLLEQKQWITSFLNQEGYPSPEVTLTSRKDPEDGHIIVDVLLDKGRPLIFHQLNFKGNHHFSHFRLKLKMDTGPAWLGIFKNRFKEPELEKDIKALTRFYHSKGFGDCEITYTAVDSGNRHMEVTIKIQEGPLYKLNFTGNDTLSARKLKKDLELFRNGNTNNIGLRKIASHIKDKYQNAGFTDAQVKIKQMPPDNQQPDIRMVEFIITEKTRLAIDTIRIKGNQAVDAKAIRQQMLLEETKWYKTHYFSEQTLDEDIRAIRALYQKKGFRDVTITKDVEKQNDEKVTVTIDITETWPTLISSVQFKGLFAVTRSRALKVISLKPGRPFREYMLINDKNALSSLISEKGYPFVSVSAAYELSKDNQQADIVYTVNEGTLVKMGRAFFAGNFKTRKKVLQRQIIQDPGDPFSLKKMLSSQKNIRDMDVFGSVSFNPLGLEQKREQVDVIVNLEERKPYYFEFGAGYETRQGFFLNTQLGDRNLFGRNKEVWLLADISQIGNRIEAGYGAPRFFNTPISIKSTLFWDKAKEFNQDFGTSVIGANIGLIKQLSKRTTTGINFRIEQRDQYGKIDSAPDYAVIEGEFKPRTVLTVTPSLSYDTRDSFVHPKKGIYSSLSADISKGIDDSLDNFIKYRLDLRYFFTPLDRLTFAWVGRIKLIDAYGEADDVPRDQLFFLGGTADVRGFEENMLGFDSSENPLGGRLAVSTSLEARIDIGKNFEIPLFYDTGRISKTLRSGVEGEFRSSVGTGLRYITPIGPIGLLYGKNLNPKAGEASGRFHLAIGYTF